VKDFGKAVRAELRDAGGAFIRHGKGDHDIWVTPNGRIVTVPVKILSRHTANTSRRTRAWRRHSSAEGTDGNLVPLAGLTTPRRASVLVHSLRVWSSLRPSGPDGSSAFGRDGAFLLGYLVVRAMS
jgi:hypothetical protein